MLLIKVGRASCVFDHQIKYFVWQFCFLIRHALYAQKRFGEFDPSPYSTDIPKKMRILIQQSIVDEWKENSGHIHYMPYHDPVPLKLSQLHQYLSKSGPKWLILFLLSRRREWCGVIKCSKFGSEAKEETLRPSLIWDHCQGKIASKPKPFAEASIILGRMSSSSTTMPLLLFWFHRPYSESLKMSNAEQIKLYNTIITKISHSGYECTRRGGLSGHTELNQDFFKFIHTSGSFPRKAGAVKFFRKKSSNGSAYIGRQQPTKWSVSPTAHPEDVVSSKCQLKMVFDSKCSRQW